MVGLLPDRIVTKLRSLIPEAILRAVQVYAIGGNAWSISRPATSDGVNAPGAPTTPTSVTGYVTSPQVAAALGGSIAGTAIPTDRWLLFTGTNQSVQVLDTITSTADSSLKFLVQTKESQIGYIVYILEPTT